MDETNRLNNIVNSSKSINEIKKYVTTGDFPDRIITGKQRTQFIKRCQGFTVEGNKLIFHANNPATRRITIEPNEIAPLLKQLYESSHDYIGMGIRLFYYKICEKYIGIKYEDVQHFLTNQDTYQLTKEFKHVHNKSIIASYPNERWAIDLIDLNQYENENNGYRYILHCADYYSKYTWARGLKKKNSKEVTEAFKAICDEANIRPHLCMSDNGGEFQGDLNRFFTSHNIKKILTLSYSPQSNGLIENANKQLRKILGQIMVRNKNNVWINYLQDAVNNRNNRRNGTIKAKPVDIWVSNYQIEPKHNEAMDEYGIGQKQNEVADNIYKQAQANLEKENNNLQVGDYVRVRQTQIRSNVRKLIKDHNKKQIIVPYSAEIFKIRSVLKYDHDKTVENKRYTLSHLDGSPFLTEQKMNKPNAKRNMKRVFASDLQLVNYTPIKVEEGEEQPISDFTQADADRLNHVTPQYIEHKPRARAKPKKPNNIIPVVYELREPSKRIRKPKIIFDNSDNLIRKPRSKK